MNRPDTYESEFVEIDSLKPWPRNYKTHGDDQVTVLGNSLRTFGQFKNVVVWGDFIIAGHGLIDAARSNGYDEIEVKRLPQDFTEEMVEAVLVADNESSRLAKDDTEQLAELLLSVRQADADLLLSTGWDSDELDELLRGLGGDLGMEGADTEPELDRAEELRQEWGVQLGQCWQLGPHKIICGDCTDPAVVERLMGGEKAALVHADPPYGMGKEKDGIANDNLYREKLDAFQMQWWTACRSYVEDNGSAYIWGNAEDLWRLWYVGGLKDSERLTFRNEIVWDKSSGQGMESEQHRMYPTGSERCLFFMLGEQGFNNNADNYWDGWEPIRSYLKEQRDLMGWDNKKVADMFGFHPRMASHWFDESQWSFIREEQYEVLQQAANGAAFQREFDELKREFDELKREFYATRAHFDNAHSNMTDVWQFGRVQGDDRHGHATPKPTEMIERAIKSSAPESGIVYVPFGGTCPELIASHNLNRTCRAAEISPAYTAISLQRYLDHTGIQPELIG